MPVPGPVAEAVMAEVWVRDGSVPRSSSSAHPAPTLQINTSIMYTSRSECLPTVSTRVLLSVHGPSCAGPTGFMHPHPGACAGRERQGRGHGGPGQSLAVRALAGARSPPRAQKQPRHYFKHMGFIRKLVHRCKDWTSQ